MKRILILCFITCFLFSCKTKMIYVPIESTKIEYKDRTERDSIYLQDSIVQREKGDTIFLERFRYLYRDKIVHDSIFKTDSIKEPYPVEIIKEVNKLKDWQTGLMCLGSATLAYIIFIIIRKLKFLK